MAVKMNLWSLTLFPGEKHPLYVRRDFQITNAALGEELRSADGRSVVKITHHPLPPIDSDSDDELDSDMENEMGDGSELDDEVEGGKGKMVNGVGGDEVDEDGDADGQGDEDDEAHEDDEYSDDEVEETVVLCSLIPGKIEQATLNLTFVEGEAFQFEVSGENAVHLIGNYINQVPYEPESDSEFSGSDDYSELEDEELDEDEEEAIKGRFTEIPETTPAASLRKSLPTLDAKPKVKPDAKPSVPSAAASKPAAAPAPSQKRKAEEIESPAPQPAATGATGTAAAEGMSKSQRKKLAKKAKLEPEGAGGEAKAAVAGGLKPAVTAGGAKPAGAMVGGAKPQKKLLPSGLILEDVKVGDGPVAKAGKRLGMRYIGKLENGKQFDANTAGKPFSFVLGKGEVISGWDQGLAGMAVGGERRLTIPAGLAYGNQKIPGIPKNSTLRFDVKLVSVA